MIIVAASNKDAASLTIKEQILKHYPFHQATTDFQQNPTYHATINGRNTTLITLNSELVQAQDLPASFPEADLIVFISRHSSQSGTPTLSVHTPGNFGEAALGGLPHVVSVAPATAMRDALQSLETHKELLSLDYEVSYESTHHGPSLNVPSMFVELGSSQAQWSDVKAGQAVAHAAMHAIEKFSTIGSQAVLGIGGPHYNQKFTEMALSGQEGFGHMIPKYALSNLTREMLLHCLERTLERVSLAVVDWKGITSNDKPKVLSVLNEVGLLFKKV
jgi:D-aminoacyl-tRNA deacylase